VFDIRMECSDCRRAGGVDSVRTVASFPPDIVLTNSKLGPESPTFPHRARAITWDQRPPLRTTTANEVTVKAMWCYGERADVPVIGMLVVPVDASRPSE
jgi:hypothetical protein